MFHCKLIPMLFFQAKWTCISQSNHPSIRVFHFQPSFFFFCISYFWTRHLPKLLHPTVTLLTVLNIENVWRKVLAWKFNCESLTTEVMQWPSRLLRSFNGGQDILIHTIVLCGSSVSSVPQSYNITHTSSEGAYLPKIPLSLYLYILFYL